MFLSEQPFAGSSTPRKNTRRFFLKPYPYTVYYRVGADEIIIQRFRHASRKVSSLYLGHPHTLRTTT